MLDWIIIGGGIHGTHHAIALRARGVVAQDRLCIVDPHATLLACWTRNTQRTGMKYLRSPRVHHLGLDSNELAKFMDSRPRRAATQGRYQCPSLDLFQEHCSHLIEAYGLSRVHAQGRVTGLTRRNGGYEVATDSGSLRAKRVLLAIGASEQTHWPAWARTLREASAPITHVFDEACALENVKPPVVVLGGGLSAVQTALRLSATHPGKVTLLSRHPARVSEFDSDPCWLGPKCLARFSTVKCLRERRETIATARQRGSIPKRTLVELRKRVASGALQWHEGEVSRAKWDGARIVLHDGHGHLLSKSGSLVLATGFAPQRPGSEWLDSAIHAMNLPTAPCGYPQLRGGISWAENLFVTGPLAELQLGPAARNISGARRAAEWIAKSA